MAFGKVRLLFLGAVGAALVIAGCSGGGQSETTDPPTLDIPTDSAQASPIPDEAPATETTYPALDLDSLGANPSPSENPSAIPTGLEVGFTEEGYPYR